MKKLEKDEKKLDKKINISKMFDHVNVAVRVTNFTGFFF
jgi:hypothetical protein